MIDDLMAGLDEMRAFALGMMQDTCRVERRTGRTMDPDTLEYVDTWELISEGVCRVDSGETQARDETTGEVERSLAQYAVWVPLDEGLPIGESTAIAPETVIGAAGPLSRHRVGDRVTVTGLGPVSDPVMEGLVLWVVDVQHGTQLTKRRLRCSTDEPVTNG